MSSSDRRSFLFLLPAALLAGCGFSPVHAPGGTGAALRGRVEVRPPDTEDEYLLVRDLEDRLGRAGVAEYELAFELVTLTQGQAVTASNETTRYSLVGLVEYKLTRSADDVVVASGNERNFTGYSATGSTVETLAGERDARKRLMAILADQIVTRLYATVDLAA